MQVSIERPEDEPQMRLLLQDLKLFLISFRSHLFEIIRDLSLTHNQNTLILKVGAKRNLNEALVASNSQQQVIAIELPLEQLIGRLVKQQRSIGLYS